MTAARVFSNKRGVGWKLETRWFLILFIWKRERSADDAPAQEVEVSNWV